MVEKRDLFLFLISLLVLSLMLATIGKENECESTKFQAVFTEVAVTLKCVK